MQKLPKIPTPLWVRWRDFRHSVAPFIFFGCALAFTVLLWTGIDHGCATAGVGEGIRSLVSSPQAGRLQYVIVQPYQLVNAGDPVAVLVPNDPRAHLDLLQAELQIVRMQLQPSVAEQNVMSFERLKLELSQSKSELAIARVNLERAENEVRRNKPLFDEKLVSEDIYDLSEKTRDAFKVEVQEKSRAIAEIESHMQRLQVLADPDEGSQNLINQEILKRLDAVRLSLGTNWGPVILTAPISGMVGGLFRQQGENVTDAEPILEVHSLWADRVVGYLRQPYKFDPMPGLKVKIIQRNARRDASEQVISQVGAQVQVITNSLAYLQQGLLVDVGLPIVINLTGTERIRPGETVDMIIDPGTEKKPWLKYFF